MHGEFFAHLSRAFPSQINVDLTEFCNLACTHCPYETVTKPRGRERRHFGSQLNRLLIDQIATDGKGLCRFIRYTGEGEPLLHPHLIEMMTYAATHGGVPVNLTSNGLLIDEDKAKALVDAGVDVFDISLDAHSDATYGSIRAGGPYSQVRDNTLRLIRMVRSCGRPVKVMVSFVLQSANRHEVEAFKAFWTLEGADFVVIRPCHSAGGTLPEVSQSLWASAPAQRGPCLYPWERVLVKPDGQVSYCPVDWRNLGNLGSLADTTIAKLWQGEAMTALRRAHCTNDFSGHPFCGACPDWALTLWPDQGTTYATAMRDLTDSSSPR